MLTVPDAARRANRDPETIRRWIRAGRLAAWKVGGQHVIDEDDLAAALRPTRSGPRSTVDPDTVASDPRLRRRARRSSAEGFLAAREAASPYGAAASIESPFAPVLDRWLPQIVGRIVRAFDPDRILLFGSRVRGDDRPDADYNLLVILDAIANRRETAIDVRLSFGELPIFAEVAVTTTAEVDGGVSGRPTGLVYWALREGITVYSRDRAI